MHTVRRLSRETERGPRNSSCRLASHWRGAKGLGACRRGRHGRVPPKTCQPRHQIQGQRCQAGEATNRHPGRGGARSHRLAGPQATYPYMRLATHRLLCGVSLNPRETAEETGGRNHFLTLRRGRLTFRENQFAHSNVTERHAEGFCLQVQNSSGGNIPANERAWGRRLSSHATSRDGERRGWHPGVPVIGRHLRTQQHHRLEVHQGWHCSCFTREESKPSAHGSRDDHRSPCPKGDTSTRSAGGDRGLQGESL